MPVMGLRAAYRKLLPYFAPFFRSTAIGLRIRMLRERRGLTQRQLASQIGTEEQFVAQVEAGNERVRPRMRRKFAQTLGVTVAELRGRTSGL